MTPQTAKPQNPLLRRATDGTVVLHTESGFRVCMAGTWLPLDALQPCEGMVVTGDDNYFRRGDGSREVVRPWRHDGTRWVEVPGALVDNWLTDPSCTRVDGEKPRAAAERTAGQAGGVLAHMVSTLLCTAEGSDQRSEFARGVLADADADVERMTRDARGQEQANAIQRRTRAA